MILQVGLGGVIVVGHGESFVVVDGAVAVTVTVFAVQDGSTGG
jgi:hypothetical protein